MWPAMVNVVDEDAVHVVREKLAMQEQEGTGVHGGAPRLADAAGYGEAPWRQAAEDTGKGVVRQCNHFRRLHCWMNACYVIYNCVLITRLREVWCL